MFAANFDEQICENWMKMYLLAMGEDYFIYQPIKCVFLFLLALVLLKPSGEEGGRRWLSPKLKRWLVNCLTGNILQS